MMILFGTFLLFMAAQASCPDLLDKQISITNIDLLEELEYRRANVMYKLRELRFYALNQAFNLACPG